MTASSFYEAWNAGLAGLSASQQAPQCWLGLMSGTSLDGVDACLVELGLQNKQLLWQNVQHHFVAYPWPLKERLLALQTQPAVALAEVSALNHKLAGFYAKVAHQTLERFNVLPAKVAGVACHGQTVHHQPPKTLATGSVSHGHTLQLGDLAVLAELTGLQTVGNFRPGDMALGGQGAPLVPFADWLLSQPLLMQAKAAIAVQNLGGIGNVSVVLSGQKPVLAFDTGPANMLMDTAMRALFAKAYDENGAVASVGQVHAGLLAQLNQHPFLALKPPKSTGREAFGEGYLLPLLHQYQAVPKEDVMATLTYFTAQTIAQAYQQFVLPQTALSTAVVGGGGVKNATLLKHLAVLLDKAQPGLTLQTHEQAFNLPSQAKEAFAFALLGWARSLNLPNTLPSCTGASGPTTAGQMAQPLGLKSL